MRASSLSRACRSASCSPRPRSARDVGAVRAYAERVEELGFAHLLAYDHVLGADPEVHTPWHGPYDIDTTFHEPFVLFGYLAAITALELVTGIIILPAAPDRARRQAGGRGRPPHRRAASGSASGSDGTRSSTRRSAPTSPTAAGGWTSRSSCCGALWTERSVTHRRQVRARDRRPGSRPCRCSDRSRCGSAPRRSRPTGASAGSPTVGSRRSRRARRSTRRARSSRTRPRAPVAIRARSAWRGASAGADDGRQARRPGRPLARRRRDPRRRSTR